MKEDKSLIDRLEDAILVCEDEGASDEGEAIREAIDRIKAAGEASRDALKDLGESGVDLDYLHGYALLMADDWSECAGETFKAALDAIERRFADAWAEIGRLRRDAVTIAASEPPRWPPPLL